MLKYGYYSDMRILLNFELKSLKSGKCLKSSKTIPYRVDLVSLGEVADKLVGDDVAVGGGVELVLYRGAHRRHVRLDQDRQEVSHVSR